ncbi:MAG: deoxyguanosinetriphosphate triphosphohydrolase [Dermabacter sp.]|nr:deoxyguanosinetriphosphate triphosphohydrolase [Dermabacter sp.]
MTSLPGIPAGYTPRDTERFFHEAPKSQTRSPFQRDRARVLHSSALRRLGAKTQVLGAGSNDFSRTRLTHSLEVAQVGRDIAQELGCDPDVVDAACLSHDLGHPPFGHNGEKVLNALAADIGGFEGNAQTLRLIARLEPKVLDGLTGRGLNLTRASVDAAIKYPWLRGEGPDPESAKFGVYEDDLDTFAWARADAPSARQCVEAQVMDISDDIAYSVHDIEDAMTGGALDLSALANPAERRRALGVVQQWYTPHLDIADLDEALVRLESESIWVLAMTGDPASAAALKNMSSQLIGRFVGSVVEATRTTHGSAPLSRYRGHVVVPEATVREISVLKGLAAAYVMSSAEQRPVYERQERVLTDLYALFTRTGSSHLDPLFRALWEQAGNAVQRQRVIVDQIASLTDVSAARLHRALFSGSNAAALAGDVPLPGLGPEL